MNPNGCFGPSPPSTGPRADDILGPPQYPKGFEKRQRDKGVESALPNASHGLGNPLNLSPTSLGDLADFPNPALIDFGEAPSRPSPYTQLDLEPSPIPSTFLVNSPLPSELFKSPGPDFDPLAISHITSPHITSPHNQNLYKGSKESDFKDSNPRDSDFRESNFRESNSDFNSDQKDDTTDYRTTNSGPSSRPNIDRIESVPADLISKDSIGRETVSGGTILDLNFDFNSGDSHDSARKDPPKVAPRSSTLYRIGPPFSGTTTVRPFFCSDTHEQIVPDIQARFDRGFEMGNAGNWIGYKRNYFTLVSAFSFRGWDLHRFARGRFHLAASAAAPTDPFTTNETFKPGSETFKPGSKTGSDPDPVHKGVSETRSKTPQTFQTSQISQTATVPIRYFALSISVSCNDPEVDIGLVQHTPKRDKGPKLPTPIYPTVPGGILPDHHTVRLSCNKKNGNKVQMVSKWFEMDGVAYMQAHDLSPSDTILSAYPRMPAKVARFERIQFTASLRVRPASHSSHSPKHFILSVRLLAYVDSNPSSSSSQFQSSKSESSGSLKPVVVAKVCSAPLLVRGRSPSKYPSERTSGFRPSKPSG